jgi:DNA replication protein DnaC
VIFFPPGSPVIFSPPGSPWHEFISDGTPEDAILDRLVHNAYKIKMKGESMRKWYAKKDDPDMLGE